MGDQRRRSKSRGCQKEGVEECGRGYIEWAWPLSTVQPGEREGEGKGGEAGTGRAGGWREGAGGRANQKQKEQMTMK